MPWVSRHTDNTVNGTYHLKQPGYAEEYLDDDHPEVVAFRQPPPPGITIVEVVTALDEIASALPPASRAKLDALLARLP